MAQSATVALDARRRSAGEVGQTTIEKLSHLAERVEPGPVALGPEKLDLCHQPWRDVLGGRGIK
jgi:hypothetical protein